ncbi:MAG TPA: DUF1801 domain-containing protein [Bacteroidia bacterium]
MHSQLHKIYINQTEAISACLLALRSIVLNIDTEITETIKYGMPCFCYQNKALCYLWTDKKTGHPYILMVEGKHLNHPKLESGERKRMKVLNIDPNKDLPLKTIQNILRQALNVSKLNKA